MPSCGVAASQGTLQGDIGNYILVFTCMASSVPYVFPMTSTAPPYPSDDSSTPKNILHVFFPEQTWTKENSFWTWQKPRNSLKEEGSVWREGYEWGGGGRGRSVYSKRSTTHDCLVILTGGLQVSETCHLECEMIWESTEKGLYIGAVLFFARQN